MCFSRSMYICGISCNATQASTCTYFGNSVYMAVEGILVLQRLPGLYNSEFEWKIARSGILSE